jgi:amidase
MINDQNPAWWSASRLQRAIRQREISSRELVSLYLERIERLDRNVGAVVTLDNDGALSAAGEADKRLARGMTDGPLHGLPMTIKDALATRGVRSTGGATELAGHVPTHDAAAVARLRAAGAIILGKTNVPRFSGDMQTFNELFGMTCNPYDAGRTCGGSSGGAAAAVACGFTSCELGTDFGGSIRIPAHCCGVYGLKPTWGVVPQDGCLYDEAGLITHQDLNTVGPIARAADDLKLLLSVLAGPAHRDAAAWRLSLPDPAPTELPDYRIGIWFDDPFCPVGREYGSLLRAAADALTAAGAAVDEQRPVDFEAAFDVYWRLLAASSAGDGAHLEQGATPITHGEYLRLAGERERFAAEFARWFECHDLLLCPVLACEAFEHDHGEDMIARTVAIDGRARPYLDVARWIGVPGIARLPVVVVPIGRTASGLPVGMQVVAPAYHDRHAIHAAGLIGKLLGDVGSPPAVQSAGNKQEPRSGVPATL